MAEQDGDKQLAQRVEQLERRYGVQEGRLGTVEKKLDENTAATLQVQSNTGEIIELFNAAKGAFSVLERLGKLARPIGYIAAAVAAVAGLWASIKGHVK